MMGFFEVIKNISIVVFLITINVSDLKCYRIKNKTIISALVVALFLSIATRTFLNSIYGMLLPLILFPFYALKMLGAGDIKAMCVVGAFVGLKLSAINMALTFISGGVIAVLFMIFNRNFVKRMKYLFNYFKMCIFSHRINSYDYGGKDKSYFRFSFAITAGTILTVVNQYICII